MLAPELVVRFPFTAKVPEPEKLPPLIVKPEGRLKDDPELLENVPPFIVKLEELKVPPLILLIAPLLIVTGPETVP